MSTDNAPKDQNQDGHAGPRTDLNIGALITGAAAAVAGWFGVETTLTRKLRPYDTEVADLVKKDVLRSLGGAIDQAGGNIAGIGGGMASGDIRRAHAFKVIESGKYPLATRLYDYFGGHSARGLAAIAAGTVTGLVGLAVGFAIFRKKSDNYDFGLAKQEAINRAKDYEANPGALDEVMLGKRTPPTQADIDRTAKYDPRTAVILEMSKDLKAAENDPAKQQEILSGWKKRLDERATQPAETVRQ